MFKSTLLMTIVSGTLFSQPTEFGPRRPQTPSAATPPSQPLVFEPNQGQTDPEVQWIARGPGYHLFLTSDGATIVHHKSKSRVKMKLHSAHPLNNITGMEPTGGVSNYFRGNDPSKWRTNVPHYQRVQAGEVYDGVDLVFYGKGEQLEYDFVVRPGADPKRIRLAFDGVEKMRLDKSGDLVLTTATGAELHHGRPKVYQEIGGIRAEVRASYDILDQRQAGFHLAAYDARKPLVIDPVLNFSRTMLGNSSDVGTGIVASGGSVVFTGVTASTDYIVAAAVQSNQPGNDAFLTKLSATGTIQFSTYLGGDGEDIATAITADSTGFYIAGYTNSTNFPAANSVRGGYDAFVTKISLTGNSILRSRVIGGGEFDAATAIAVAADGSAYVAGNTNSYVFPVRSAFQHLHAGDGDAFLVKLTPGGDIDKSTYIGGSGADSATGVTVDPQGFVTVVGMTVSPNFPTRGAPPMLRGGDAFVTRFIPAMTDLAFSAYLGSTEFDQANAVTSDPDGYIYIAGHTKGADFPTTPGAFMTRKPSPPGQYSGFLTKLGPYGHIVVSTYVGGKEGGDLLTAVGIDSNRAIYVGGILRSLTVFGLPVMGANPGAGFYVCLTPSASLLNYIGLAGSTVAGLAVVSPIPNRLMLVGSVNTSSGADVYALMFTESPPYK